jgi:hypothetical protein
MKQPSARERLYLHWNPLAANHDEMYSLLLEVERAAAYRAMMRCSRMYPKNSLVAAEIRAEARKLKKEGK